MTALRSLSQLFLKSPGFSAVVIAALALGLGVCAAMFTLSHAVLFKSLPFEAPERLVWIENQGGDGGLSSRTLQALNVRDWQSRSRSFSAIGAYYAFFEFRQFILGGAGEPLRVQALPVTGNFLDVLGVQPALGRNFSADELEMDWNTQAYPAAILTHRFWQRHFASDPEVIGRPIRVNNRQVNVVGVLPSAFDIDDVFMPEAGVDMLLPLPLSQQTQNEGNTVFALGRLAAGVTLAQARDELAAVSAALAADHPERGTFGAHLVPIEEKVRGSYRTAFLILSGAVLALLLIVCLNLSNLLLVRAQSRSKALATRMALGATPWMLVRQALVESLALSILGGLLGLGLAMLALQGAGHLSAFRIPMLAGAALNPQVLGGLAVTTLLAGLLCGLLPALMIRRGKVGETINESGTRASAGAGASRLRQALVMLQVALACSLLICSSLLIESFRNVLKVDVGFQPGNLLAVRVDTSRSFTDLAESLTYYDALRGVVQRVPGVTALGLSDTLPFGRNRSWGFGAAGVSYPPSEGPIASPRMVDPMYLPTLGVPLRSGRHFAESDRADTEAVVMVSESLARQLWPGRDAVGEMLSRPWDPEDPYGRVVGVVADVPRELEGDVAADVYFNIHQTDNWASLELVVRADRPLPGLVTDIRRALATFDPELASGNVLSFDEILANSMAPRSVTTSLMGGFSVLSLLVAALGIYSVIAFATAQRHRELAIRRALGSGRGRLAGLVLGESARIALSGVALGLLLAWLASAALQSLLFGIEAQHPGVFALNALFVAGVALFASLVPAVRAARVSPVQALR